MQFTPQQLAGAHRYGSQTRIGNWYEDVRLAEARFAAFTTKKEKNLLRSDNRRKKTATCLQKVPLSFCPEKMVRYGAVIQLQCAQAGGKLACDPFEETSLGSQSYLVTVCPGPSGGANAAGERSEEQSSVVPARTAFRLVKASDPRLKDMASRIMLSGDGKNASVPELQGDPVCLGDQFHLVCDPGLRVCETSNMRKPDLYLASAQKTEYLTSRVSNQQAVFLKKGASSGTVWQFQKTTHGKDGPIKRTLCKGSPVVADTEVVLQHRDTLMALSCEEENIEPTDFGAEFEVCCSNRTTNGRTLQLVAERKGRKTAAAAAKAELRANRWVVRQATAPRVDSSSGEGEEGGGNAAAHQAAQRQLPPEMTAENIMHQVRRAVIGRPMGGRAHALRLALRAICPASSGRLDREDVRWGLHDFGVPLDEEQSQILLDAYDRDGSGLVSVEEFLSGLREPLSEDRKNILEEAFRNLGPDENGQVNLQNVESKFDAKAAALTMNNAAESDAPVPVETLEALRVGWGKGARVGSGGGGKVVTLPAFERYHQDLLVGAEDDDIFQAIVKAEWRSQ